MPAGPGESRGVVSVGGVSIEREWERGKEC